MIDRYSRAEMKRVWSDENKYRMWLDVELAVCEAWTEAGVIPPGDLEGLRGATYNHQRMMEIFETTRHDVTAFLRSITETLGPEGRWLHLGMTSSDMLDTGQALQLVTAADLLLGEIDAAVAAVKEQAIRHKDTLMMGRTHGVHAEPMTFGLKLALWWDELRRQRERMAAARESVRVGKISGAVGTHATIPPHIEERVCHHLGLKVEPVSNQVVQRDRYAHFITTCALVAASLEKFATEIRGCNALRFTKWRNPSARGRPARLPCPTSATRSLRNASAAWRALSAATPCPPWKMWPCGGNATLAILRPSASSCLIPA